METALFLLGKLAGLALRVETWLILLALVGVVAQARGRAGAATRAGAALLALLTGLTVLPLGNLLLRPLEAAYPPDPPVTRVVGIIVLGGAEDVASSRHWGGVQLRAGGERLVAAAELARRYPEARLLLAGGGGALRDVAGPSLSEAAIAADFLRRQGIAADRLILEARSRNTAENARLGLAQITGQNAGQIGGQDDGVWLLVTSAHHMPRAMRSFAAAGWRGLVAYPVDFRSTPFVEGLGWKLAENLDLLNIAIREWVGGLAYRLTGR
jgi:uncharacterized SAM-binding protein YcdF (DUF218 family)